MTGLGRYLCRFEDGAEVAVWAHSADAALDGYVMELLAEWGFAGEEPRDGRVSAMREDGSDEASFTLDFEGWGL